MGIRGAREEVGQEEGEEEEEEEERRLWLDAVLSRGPNEGTPTSLLPDGSAPGPWIALTASPRCCALSVCSASDAGVVCGGEERRGVMRR